MRIMDTTPSASRGWLAVCGLVGAVPLVALAGPVKFDPSLTVAPYYTSNVERQASDEQQSLVTDFIPELALNGYGRDYSVFADYSYHYKTYSDDSDANKGYHQLNASAEYRLLQWLGAYADARISQQATNPDEGLSADIGNRSGNVSDVRSFSTGLRGAREGYWVRGQGDLGARFVSSDASSFQSTTGYDGNLLLQQGVGTGNWFYEVSLNGSRERYDNLSAYHTEEGQLLSGVTLFRGIGVYGRLFRDQATFGEEPQQALGSAGIGLRYSPGPQLSLDVGYDWVTEGDQDDYVSARGSWRPTSRTQLEANYGQRYFGKSWGLAASHGTRLLQQSLSYREEVSSTSRAATIGLPYDEVCPVDTPVGSYTGCVGLPPGSVIPDGTEVRDSGVLPLGVIDNQVYLSKMWLYDLSLRLRANQFRLNLYQEDRNSASDIRGDSLYQDRGVRGEWRVELSERTSVGLDGWFRSYRREAEVDRDQEWSTRLSLSRKANSYSNWSVDGGYFRRNAVVETSSYDEWRAGLSYTIHL